MGEMAYRGLKRSRNSSRSRLWLQSMGFWRFEEGMGGIVKKGTGNNCFGNIGTIRSDHGNKSLIGQNQ